MATAEAGPNTVMFHGGEVEVSTWPEAGEYRLRIEPPLSFGDAERIGLIEASMWLPELDWTNAAKETVRELSFTRSAAKAYLDHTPERRQTNDLSFCIQLGQKVFEALTDKEED